ncbi:MAG TPA: hypothetical protein VFW87_14390 [Pirellulales bacterium]|nr:hypothetical protein [Pirellulales bacterium]
MHFRRIAAIFAILATCVPALGADEPNRASARGGFAANMSKLAEGDSKQRVRELLGPPDDVRTHHDPDEHFILDEGVEVWCYGTNGHLTFPTLGLVLVDDDGKAVFFAGGGGEPPKPDLFEEDQLRTLLRQIDRLQPDSSWNYNPARTIEVVNALQPLGKEKALAAVDEYLRVHSAWNDDTVGGIFLMLRVLFDPPDDPGYWPNNVRGTSIKPADPKLIPRFPMVLQDDIPLLVYIPGGRLSTGRGLPVGERMARFRATGKIRQRPLSPSNRPAAAVEAFIKLPPRLTPGRLWEAEENAAEHSRNHAVNQLLWLIESVYRPDQLPENGDKIDATESKDRRQKLLSEIAKLDIRWEAARNRFTFKDGILLNAGDRRPHAPSND